MTATQKVATWCVVVIVLVGVIVATVRFVQKRRRIVLQGAIVRKDADPQKQLPIADVQVTAIMNSTTVTATSDASGLFTLTLPRGFRHREPVTLEFRHLGYQPLDLKDFVADKLYIAAMAPVPVANSKPDGPETTIANVRVRYTVKTTTDADVGSAVKTFQVQNVANLPCKGQHPCSPDGKWKATIASTTLDAGEGNQFRNVRVSCIAGPCPFARIEFEDLSQQGQHLNVSARAWSDTVTYLLEADVVHSMVADIVRLSYPVLFDRAMEFSLPVSAEGPSLQAEVNGDNVVFPLGPALRLSWAQCSMAVNKDQATIYRCQLKPGYRFK
ncbi:MAG TPA: carboxypeptidase-like regulatory domain-containing protein [Terriglobales bacterium]